MTLETIECSFTYHPPKDGQPDKYQMLREQAKSLATTIFCECPASPETTLAIRKVEEAVMWANKSIACNE